MTSSLAIQSARPEERAAAFELAFQHLSARERSARVAAALELVGTNEIDPAGILVARQGSKTVGSVICMPTPGAGGLLWPPQVRRGTTGPNPIEDQLVRFAIDWLRQRGAKLAQAMLVPAEAHLGEALVRNQFKHVTTLWYLRLGLEEVDKTIDMHLDYAGYPTDPETFHQTLLQSYENSQDCPELTGVRAIEEIIDGHRHQGVHDPALWLLARHGDKAVGILLLTRMPEWNSWDVCYVGVVPEERGRGFGRELMQKAMVEARQGGSEHLTLSVDARNLPAWELYRDLGFEPFDQREVFLAIWT